MRQRAVGDGELAAVDRDLRRRGIELHPQATDRRIADRPESLERAPGRGARVRFKTRFEHEHATEVRLDGGSLEGWSLTFPNGKKTITVAPRDLPMIVPDAPETDTDGFAADDAEVRIYYGAADTAIGLAEATVGELVEACTHA